MKKFLSLTLAFMVLIALVPTNAMPAAYAAETEQEAVGSEIKSGSYTYDFVDKTKKEISLVKYEGTAEKVNLGEKVDGYSIVKVCSYAFKNAPYTKEIIVPQNVRELEECAFSTYYNSHIETVKITGKIENIPYGCFSGCTSLKTVTLPDSIKEIGESAFSGCSALTSVSIPKNVELMGQKCFEGCSSLKSAEIPANVTYVPWHAFTGCTSLSKVTFKGNKLETIGGDAFKDTALVSVSLPASLAVIGEAAFYNCNSLQSINFPNNIQTIYYSAFEYCTSLKEVVFNERESKLQELGFSAFRNCSSLKKAVLPESLETLNAYTFDNCESLVNVYLPNSLKSIDFRAFNYCTPTLHAYEDSVGMRWAKDQMNIECISRGKFDGAVGCIYGDFDHDDTITSADSLYILRYSVNLDNPISERYTPAIQDRVGDVTADDKIQSDDALCVLRYSVKLTTGTGSTGKKIQEKSKY